MLHALAVEGRPLEPLRLLALADFLDSIDDSRAGIRRAAGSFPLLEAMTGAVASFKRETTPVREKIEPSGEVVDHASPELKLIRERQRKQRTRLRGTLESFLRGKETAKYLQDQVVTERNGRYVLVIKAEHRSSIPGIVHGASTSGASLFLEPLSTVEINNDIVALEEQEREEIHRILLGLTDAFRARGARFPTARWTPRPSWTCCRRARGSRSWSTASNRGSPPTARSSCWRRDTRLLMAEVTTRLAGAAADDSPSRAPRSGPVPVTIKIVPPATLSAGHRAEYGRQDRGAQDRRAARDDGAGRPARSGGRRIAPAGVRARSSRTSATSSRSTPA